MISVVIPAYKNVEELVTNLKANLPLLAGCEVIVVNDDPTKSIKGELSGFSEVKLIENKENVGFGATVNEGVKASTGEYLMFLNTDVTLQDNSYLNTIKHFQNDDALFAIAFAQKEKHGEVVGKNIIFWKNGFFRHDKASDLKAGNTAWAEGGSCLIDKKKFNLLGGFDSLYAPFYWEDIDLSYRAWKAGYKVLFDPAVMVTHYHGTTIDKYFKTQKVREISYRNQFIFVWKNILSRELLSDHHKRLPRALISSILRFDMAFIKGYRAAKKLQDTIEARKNQIASYAKLSDEEVLSLFSHE